MQQDTHDQLRAERIEALAQQVSTFSDPHVRETVEELLQTLLDMYGEGLARILELTKQAKTPGFELIKTFADDELIGSLLLLHDLHPVDIKTRIVRALNGVRPYLQSHGGNVELINVEKGVAYLRLEGSCHGCQASAITLKQTIEEAIYKAAPDLDRLEVDGVTDQLHMAGTPFSCVSGGAGDVAQLPRNASVSTGSFVAPSNSMPVTFIPTRRNRESPPLTIPGKG